MPRTSDKRNVADPPTLRNSTGSSHHHPPASSVDNVHQMAQRPLTPSKHETVIVFFLPQTTTPGNQTLTSVISEMKGFESGTTRRGGQKRARSPRTTCDSSKEHHETQAGNPQIRVAKMHLNQDWKGIRRNMDRTGARAREPYPNHDGQDHEPMVMKLNRIMEEATSRSGQSTKRV